jgi:peptidylprolyl isomerase
MAKVKSLMAAILLAAAITGGFMAKANAADPENTLFLDLKDGRVVIELLPEKAPNHVARIKELVRKGFYDGIVFHRVIDGFMAQTGDPTGTGSGGSGKKLNAEFNDEPHTRGAVSMARAASPDSADSQFFLVLKDSNFLDRQYTVWGRVTSGMEFVDNIKKGNAAANGAVSDPDKIVKLQVAADVKEEAKPAAEEKPKEEAKPAKKKAGKR